MLEEVEGGMTSWVARTISDAEEDRVVREPKCVKETSAKRMGWCWRGGVSMLLRLGLKKRMRGAFLSALFLESLNNDGRSDRLCDNSARGDPSLCGSIFSTLPDEKSWEEACIGKGCEPKQAQCVAMAATCITRLHSPMIQEMLYMNS